MTLQRWSAAGIIEYFVKHPKGKILISAADMNAWLRNTENTITILPYIYSIVFSKWKSHGVWEGELKLEEKVKSVRGLRLK